LETVPVGAIKNGSAATGLSMGPCNAKQQKATGKAEVKKFLTAKF
jgi:hypothetical protein